MDEFYRFVRVQFIRHHPFHAMGAGTGITEYRVGSILADFQEGLFQFAGFCICNIKKALALPWGSTTKPVHPIWKEYFISGLFQYLDGYLGQGLFIRIFHGRAHALVETAGKIDHLRFIRSGLRMLRCECAKFYRPGHLPVPDPELFKWNNFVYCSHKAQSRSDKKVDCGEVFTYPVGNGIAGPFPCIVAGTKVFDHYARIDGKGTANGT